MSSFVSTFLWKHVFTAFLPPLNPEDVDYYTVLGLPQAPAPSTEDVRKAYRKLSLELHPDKVAQRGGDSDAQEEARLKYEAVQQAYGVLVDPKTRAHYNDWKSSPTRYQFVANAQQQWLHPVQLYENLAQASLLDKSKLILLVSICLLSLLVQPILICVKVNQNGRLEDAPWLLVLTPLWIFGALGLAFWLLLATVTKTRIVILAALEYAAWLSGSVLLACIWDKVLSVNWYVAAIPFYAGIALRAWQSIVAIRSARHEQGKMISPDQHHRMMHTYREKLHEHRPPMDIESGQEIRANTEGDIDSLLKAFPTEEAYIEYLQEEYTIVTLNQEAVAAAISLMEMPDESGRIHIATEEEIEMLRITSSAEYVALDEAVEEQRKSVYTLILIGITFVTLVAYKLEASPIANWWAIFTPIWIYFGSKVLGACFVCCCASVSGDTVIIRPTRDVDAPSEADENDMSKHEGVSGSVTFAAAEGEMDEFNDKAITTAGGDVETAHPVSEKVEKPLPTAVEPVNSTATSASGVAPVPATKERNDPTTNSGPNTKGSKTSTTGDGDAAAKTSLTAGTADGNDDTVPNEPDIDFEEAYFAWQNAHAQSQQSAMEQQSKAVGTCCISLFQLIIVCCIVAKLQNVSDGDYGFNTLWILFPVFFFTGIVLCCCTCFIYTASPDSLTIITDRTKKDQDESSPDTNAEASQQQPAMVAAATPEVTGTQAEADNEQDTAEPRHIQHDSAPTESNGEPDKDMDDLD